jgi:hypothetical protein
VAGEVEDVKRRVAGVEAAGGGQGLTLVHFFSST